jgi:hypothetical protein
MADDTLPAKGKAAEIDAFLRKVAATPVPARAGRGRLAFAMDATASRESTWAAAQGIHAAMFSEAAKVGGLDIQLMWYRGLGEFVAGPWTSQPDLLLGQLKRVGCIGGETQIEKVLRHTLAESRKGKVHALVFVGDCMEENVDTLCRLAGELGLLGVPMFLFHEGDDQVAAAAFHQMARLSGGACCRFDAGSAGQLRELLSAVAVFAAGGRQALVDYGRRTGGAAALLTSRMGGKA